MRKKILKKHASKRLILIFTDWATDHALFEEVDVPGYDLMVLSDYTDLSFNWKPFMAYDEICLVAWGFGVFAASLSAHEIMSRVTLRMAVNGTLDPVNDTRGMHLSVFNRLAYSLTPKVLWDYYSRMSTTNEQCARLHDCRPNRTLASLSCELTAIESLTIFHVPQITDWDVAVVSQHDVLFPPANQHCAWRDICRIENIPGGHYPYFAKILSEHIINKEHITESTDNQTLEGLSKKLYGAVLKAAETEEMLGDVLEVGHASGIFNCQSTPYTLLKPAVAETELRRTASGTKHLIFGCDVNKFVNSPRTFLRECRRVLTDGGIMAFVANKEWEDAVPADCEVRLMHKVHDYLLIIAETPQR